MTYPNGRKANNGDILIRLLGGKIEPNGYLFVFGSAADYCMRCYITPTQSIPTFACAVDCLHVDDLAEILKEKGLDKRAPGK